MKILYKILSWAVPAYIFLLPWQARHILDDYSFSTPAIGGLSLYVTDLLFFVIVLAWTYWMIAQFKRKSLAITRPQKIWLLVGFLFVGYTALASYWAPHDLVAGVAWDRIIQGWFIIAMIVTLRVRARIIVIALLLSGVVQSLFAIAQFFIQEIEGNKWLGMAAQNSGDQGVSVIHFQDQRWLRSYGTLPHPNMLGAFLALTALIATAWHFHVYIRLAKTLQSAKATLKAFPFKKMRIEILASLGSFLFLITGLLFSFSRTAWLGFTVSWVLLLLLLLRRSDKKTQQFIGMAAIKQVIAGVAILTVLSLIFGPLWTSRVNDSSRVAEISVTERAMLTEQAKEIIADHWIIGVGLGGYLPTLIERDPGLQIYEYQPVHNVWLLAWAELGLVGLGMFIVWIVYLIYILSLLWKKERAQGLSINQALIFSGLFGIGVMAYFDHFWWSLPFGVLITSIWLGLFVKTRG